MSKKFAMITYVYVILVVVLAAEIGCAQAELEKGYVVFEYPAMENLPPTYVQATSGLRTRHDGGSIGAKRSVPATRRGGWRTC